MHLTGLAEESESLFTTKLQVPLTRPYHIARPRLVQQLKGALKCKLTLVSAPAGYGKTTALIDWQRLRRSAQPLAWLSLDQDDNDPRRFWQHVTRALRTARIDISEQVPQLFNSPQPPPLEALLLTIIQAVANAPQHFVLVLDDYHLITTPAIHEGLDYLLAHLPPQMHIVISSREEPPLALNRLRAHKQLKELQTSDLRFTSEEATILFNQVMELKLPEETIAALVASVEGWIMGLHLLGFSLRGNVAIHITAPNTLVDYLLDQALSVQSERMQDFLLSTSLLNRLNGSLCDELLNQTGSQEILEILERGNPFIVRLDERQRWYGYHPFFRDALRTRLAVKYADRLPLLHLRAASWYERADQLHEATYHALAANDYYRATRLVERQSSTLLQRGEVATVQAWLEAFPLEFICLHTRLILLQAWMHVLVNRLDEAEADLQAVEELLDGTKTPEILGQIAAIRSGISVAQYDIPGSIEAARTALAQLPEDALMVRGFVSRNLGIACWLKDDVAAAAQAFANAVSYNHASSNIYAALIVSCDLANLQMVQGQLQKADTTYEQVLEYIGSADFLPVIRRARQGLGSLLYEWNELDSAEDFVLAGMTFDAAGEQVQVTLNSVSIQARIKQVQGDEDEVWRLMQEGEDYIYRHHATRLVPVLSMQRARLWLMQDNIAEAGEWVVASGLSFDDALNQLREAEYLTLARVYIAQRKLVLALGLLERLRQQAEAGKRVGSLIEIAILEALAWQEQGEMQQALAALVDAFALAKPEGYIRIFVDEGVPMEALLTKALEMRSELEGLQKIAPGYIRMLLATIKQERLWRELPEEQHLLAPQIDESEEPVESLLEPLTEREIEILRLVAAGLPNRAIAAHIVV
ncbi:MAG TPA: hypothetical protein VGT82_00100, partial [Ktedonobacteraceae bacterium]|nr:hypothetical protein [Ktedonobacteraceae bacterium]